ncbi:Hypothetical protein D9617_1g088810 [Elsinoe fawcettii]|nr:Hypothetical protein D9617_1g088810 [Elsinoe fawcettii]
MARTRTAAGSGGNAAANAGQRKKRLDKQALIHNATQAVQKKAKKKKSDPMVPPPGYSFLVVGYPDLAEKCRALSEERGVDFRQISQTKNGKGEKLSHISQHLHRVGYHIRTDIFDEGCKALGYHVVDNKLTKQTDAQSMQEYEGVFRAFGIDTAQETQKKDDEEDARKVQATIRELFPLIPEDEANQIFSRAWQKGSQNIGRAEAVPVPRKVQLAVAAHIRHQHTDYDRLLNAKVPWLEARKRVESASLRKIIEWQGGEDPEGLLAEAYQGVLEDTLVISDDETPAERSEPDRYADNESSSDDSIVIENNPAAIAAELERPPSAYESATDFYEPRKRPRRSMDEGKRRHTFLAKVQQARTQSQQHQRRDDPVQHTPYQHAYSSTHATAPPHQAHPSLQSPLYASAHTPQPYHGHVAPQPPYSPYSPAHPPPVHHHHQQHYQHPSLPAPLPPPPQQRYYAPQPEYSHQSTPVYAHQHQAYQPPPPPPLPVQDLPPQRFFDEDKREVLLDPATHELVPIKTDSFKQSESAATSSRAVSVQKYMPPPLSSHSRAITVVSDDDDDDAYEPSVAVRPQSPEYSNANRNGQEAYPAPYSKSDYPSTRTVAPSLPPVNPYRQAVPETTTKSAPPAKLSRRERLKQKKAQKKQKQVRNQQPDVEMSYDDVEEEEYDPSQAMIRAPPPPPPHVVARNAQPPPYHVPVPPPPPIAQAIPTYDRRNVAPAPLPQHGAPALIQPSHRTPYHPQPPPPPMLAPQYAAPPPMYQQPVQHYQYAPPPPPPAPAPQYYQQPLPGYDPYYPR